MRNRADRHHLVVLAAHIKIEQIVRLQAGPRLGLHIDLPLAAKAIEIIYEISPHERLQGFIDFR